MGRALWALTRTGRDGGARRRVLGDATEFTSVNPTYTTQQPQRVHNSPRSHYNAHQGLSRALCTIFEGYELSRAVPKTSRAGVLPPGMRTSEVGHGPKPPILLQFRSRQSFILAVVAMAWFTVNTQCPQAGIRNFADLDGP